MSITILNARLAEKIKQLQLIPAEIVTRYQTICDKQSQHLGQLLVRQNLLSTTQLGKIMQAINNLADSNSDFPSSEISALDGKEFGNFEIIEEIARGGMGIVYKARQKGINRQVALKVLFKGKDADEQQIRRFLREGKIIAQLDHPNIVPLYSMGQVQGYHYLTMLYIQGGTFQDLIDNANLSLRDKLQPLIKVARALHRAHRQKILHRDIKPSNILLDQNGEPYLTDFGLAKQTDQESFNLTGSADVLGTPFYMSPEQVQSQHDKIGPASDIYSMGVLLYHLLTRQVPFVANNMTALFVKIVEQDPLAPRKIDANIPQALEDICLKAMHKNISLRYQSMSAFANDLERFCRGSEVMAQKERYRLRFFSFIRQHRHYLMVLALLLPLLLGLFIFWQISRQRQLDAARKQSPQYQWQLAQQQFSQKKYRESMQYLRRLLTACPLHLQGLILQSKILAIEKRWNQARFIWLQIAQVTNKANILEWLAQNAFNAGFLDEANSYCAKAISLQPESEKLAILMGNILLYGGELTKADEHFHRVKNPGNCPEMLPSQALLCYCRNDYQGARQYLDQLKTGQFSRFAQIRCQFLRIRMMWQELQQDLMTWQWLFGSEQAMAQPIRNKLRNILKRLQQCSAGLAKISEHYPILIEKQNIKIYRTAVEQELAPLIPAEPFRLSEALKQPYLTSNHEILLQQTHIRYLLRCQKWDMVYRLCNNIIHRFPWEKDFYHLRLLAGYHLPNLDDWTKDIANFAKTKHLDFTPACNLLFLLGDKPDQKKFYEFYPLIFYYFSIMPLNKFDQKFFARYYANWAAQQNRNPQRQSQLTAQELKSIWKKALYSDSASTRLIAGNIVALQHDNPKLEPQLRYLEPLSGDPAILKQRKQKIAELIARQRQRQKIKELRQLLLQFSVGQDISYILQVMKRVPDYLCLLAQLISDENEHPLARLYAVTMLHTFKSERSEKALAQLYQRGYPFDLLVSCCGSGKNKFQHRIELPPRFFKHRDLFFRMLAARYLPIEQYRSLLIRLLNCGEEMVALCAAYNFRISSDSNDDFVKVSKRLQQLFQSPQTFVQQLSLHIFWNFGRSASRKALVADHWRRYSYLLLKALQREEPLQLMAVLSMISNKHFHDYLLLQVDSGNDLVWQQIVQKLKQLRRNGSSYTLRFLSATAIGFSCNNHDIMERMHDGSTPFYIRIAGAFGITAKHRLFNLSAEMMLLFRSFAMAAIRQPKNDEDKRLQRYTLMVQALSTFGRGRWSKMRRGYSDYYLQCDDYALKKIAVSGLIWNGRRQHIAKVRLVLKKAKDADMKQAAVMTLAALISLYEPGKSERFNAWIAKQDLPLRRAAAFGYHSLILRQFSSHEFISFVDYQSYIKIFREHANKNWIKPLKNCTALSPSIRYLYELALCYLVVGENKEAIEIATKALTLNREDVDKYCLRLQLLLAEAYSKIENFHKLTEVCQQALKENPLDSRIYKHLADACAKLGFKDKAEKYSKRAQLLNYRTENRSIFDSGYSKFVKQH